MATHVSIAVCRKQLDPHESLQPFVGNSLFTQPSAKDQLWHTGSNGLAFHEVSTMTSGPALEINASRQFNNWTLEQKLSLGFTMDNETSQPFKK